VRLAIGGDHAGFALKWVLGADLRNAGHDVHDFGAYSAEPVDFPDVARLVCGAVTAGESDRGIMVCGTGVGACILPCPSEAQRVRRAAIPMHRSRR